MGIKVPAFGWMNLLKDNPVKPQRMKFLETDNQVDKRIVISKSPINKIGCHPSKRMTATSFRCSQRTQTILRSPPLTSMITTKTCRVRIGQCKIPITTTLAIGIPVLNQKRKSREVLVKSCDHDYKTSYYFQRIRYFLRLKLEYSKNRTIKGKVYFILDLSYLMINNLRYNYSPISA